MMQRTTAALVALGALGALGLYPRANGSRTATNGPSNRSAILGYESPPEEPPASPLTPAAPRRSRPDEVAGAFNVHLHSGEFHLSVEDMRIPGRGLDFVWTRSYRSRLGRSTVQGNGWDFSYGMRIAWDGPGVRLADGNNRSDLYLPQPNGTYTAVEFFREGAFDSISGEFTLTFADGGEWVFHPLSGAPHEGRIARIADRNGNTLFFSYDATGRLIQVVDTLGRPLTIAYDVDGLIETVTDFTGRSVEYAYYQAGDTDGTAGDLASVRSPVVVGTPNGNDFPSGKTSVYTYSTGSPFEALNHNLLTITDPKGQTWLRNTYASPAAPPLGMDFDRIVQQEYGDPGDVISITYVAPGLHSIGRSATSRAIVNDRVGNVCDVRFDANNRCTRVREYTGRWPEDQPTTLADLQGGPPVPRLRATDPAFFATRFTYNEDALVTAVVEPNGTRTERQYELDLDVNAPWRSRGNLRVQRRLPGSHLPAGDQVEIVEAFTYETGFGSCCGTNFVKEHTDARGNVTTHDYDSFGNRIRTVHRIPSIVEDFEYNGFGQQTAHVLPDNGSGHRRRDERAYYTPADGHRNGYLKNEVVDAGNESLTTEYDYDPRGNATRVVDPRGGDTLHTFNALDQVVREESRLVTIPGPLQFRYTTDTFYDANDNIERVDVENRDGTGVVPAANPWFSRTFEYDTLDFVVREIREVSEVQDVVLEYGYDANRNRVSFRNGEATNGNDPGNTVESSYDERDLIYRRTSGAGGPTPSTSQTDYDGNRNITAERSGLEDGEHVELRVYDAYDRRVAVTDAMGNDYLFHYDANGNLGGDATTGVPNPFAVLVMGELVDLPGSTGNVRLREVMRTYDPMDRMTESVEEHFDTSTQVPIDDGQSTTQLVFSDSSHVRLSVDDGGHVTTNEYDTVNRLLTVTDPKGNTVEYAYDANGNVTAVTEVERSDLGQPDETFVTAFEYDALDRRIGRTDNLLHPTSWTYDSRGNRVRTKDARGNLEHREYDGLNRLFRIVRDLTDTGDGTGTVVEQQIILRTWDDSSRLTSETDGEGNTTAFSYDSLNRQTGVIHADCTARGRLYDAHGVVIEETDANGTIVESTHDGLDRLTRREVVQLGAGVLPDTLVETYARDGLHRLVEAADEDSRVTFAHDSLSNVVSEGLEFLTTGDAHVVGSSWSGDGLRTEIVYPGGLELGFEHDARHLATSLVEDPNGSATPIAAWDWIGTRRIERRDFGNGVRRDCAYDGDRRIVSHRDYVAATNLALADRTYLWDDVDNKASERELLNFQIQVYGHDSVNRLVRSQDVSGPIVTYDLDLAQSREVVVGGNSAGNYTMDATLCDPADRQMNQYTQTPFGIRKYDDNGNLTDIQPSVVMGYDFRDRLVRYDDPNGTSLYRHDCLGRRIEKDVAGVVTRFLYDGDREIEERDGLDQLLATTVWDSLPIRLTRGSADFFLHANDQGNTMFLTNALTLVVERVGYEDYGLPAYSDANGNPLHESAIGNPFGFNAERFDAETGFYRGARLGFDPLVGVYLESLGWPPLGALHNEGNAHAPWGVNPVGLCGGGHVGQGPGAALPEPDALGALAWGFSGDHSYLGCGAAAAPEAPMRMTEPIAMLPPKSEGGPELCAPGGCPERECPAKLEFSTWISSPCPRNARKNAAHQMCAISALPMERHPCSRVHAEATASCNSRREPMSRWKCKCAGTCAVDAVFSRAKRGVPFTFPPIPVNGCLLTCSFLWKGECQPKKK